MNAGTEGLAGGVAEATRTLNIAEVNARSMHTARARHGADFEGATLRPCAQTIRLQQAQATEAMLQRVLLALLEGSADADVGVEAKTLVFGAMRHCTLVAPNSCPDDTAADTVVTFEAQWHSTLRQEQPEESCRALTDALHTRPVTGHVGVEFSTFGPHFHAAFHPTGSAQLLDIEHDLWQLRRNKDPDELAMIGRAIECTDAMYQRAREIITPGITELEVFNQLHAAAVEVAREPLTALGNDYQANSPGGPPRPRPARAGELFVLDLGPAYRGYFADNCRTVSVDGRPTDDQLKAWQMIVNTLEMVERTVRPGVSCRDVFQAAQDRLDEYRVDAFSHHLGHAFGLFPHEGPHPVSYTHLRAHETDS